MKPIASETQQAQVTELFKKGLVLHQKNKLQEAKVVYEQILKIHPQHFDSYALLGLLSGQTKQFTQAIDFLTKALQINPYHAETCFNMGLALKQLKRFDESIASYDKAITLKPDYAEAYSTRGNVLQEIKRFDEAVASYEGAIRIRPDYPEALYNRGIVLKELRRFEEALSSYKQAILIKPLFAEALNNQGLVLHELRRFDEALFSYNQVIRINPHFAEAYYNCGNTLQEMKRFNESLASYDKGIALKPDYYEAHSNRGIVLKELKRFEEALQSYATAIQIKPDYADAYYNRGVDLQELKQFDVALVNYEKALSIKVDYDYILGNLQHVKMMMCCWRNFDHQIKEISQKTHAKEKVAPPFALLGLEDTPSIHRISSEMWVQEKFPLNTSLGPIPKNPTNTKIRLGYFSADFRNHPVSYLTAELFEIHNKDRFEIIAFAFGPDVKDEMHNRLSKAFDQFIDVRDKSDQEVAMLSRRLGVNIAIDLGGFTGACRTGILSYQAAPIQISYIGYLGTSGAPYIDYLIADKTIVPLRTQKYYSEKIVYLPSYQVNDRKRIISDKQFTRSELGLPEKGFVFCCFNNNFKFTPDIFDGWMRILKAVDSSVLFLYAENKWVQANLKKEASDRGVEANRLCFGKSIDREEYLARYRICDLFLDTFPYNAGTTASDALWAGLPVLTIMGESFASRMAASLLTAIDLPELITSSQENYEALAIELATNPAKLKGIKTKLESNRLTTPLFDTPRFTKHLEDAYTKIYERYHADLPPEHIYIEDEAKTNKV